MCMCILGCSELLIRLQSPMIMHHLLLLCWNCPSYKWVKSRVRAPAYTQAAEVISVLLIYRTSSVRSNKWMCLFRVFSRVLRDIPGVTLGPYCRLLFTSTGLFQLFSRPQSQPVWNHSAGSDIKQRRLSTSLHRSGAEDKLANKFPILGKRANWN